MGKQYLLSHYDHRRLSEMLRWWDKHKNDRTPQRRRSNSLGIGNSPVLAKTQAAAGGGDTISVKLLDSAGEETGDAITATALFADAGTALDAAFPRIADDKEVLVILITGSWYIFPTFIKSRADCP